MKTSLGLKFDGRLQVLDQSQLPWKEEWIQIRDSYHMVETIKTLQVRGAPLIGVAAALALAMDAKNDCPNLADRAIALREARPTAVNLANAIDRLKKWIDKGAGAAEGSADIVAALVREAETIFDDEEMASMKMAQNGQAFIGRNEGVLTHCNTGGLATVGLGTALSVPILAHQNGLGIHVYVDETRPLLQGARLNTWELQKHGVEHTLICDNMAGSLMAEGRVQRVFVGADRIALNGDFANKIGTYSLAILAHFHRIPFYVVAPLSTVDLRARTGSDIPIEERASEEVLGARGPEGRITWTAKNTNTWNPAFDRTPCNLLTALITEEAVYSREELDAGVLCETMGIYKGHPPGGGPAGSRSC